MDTFSSQREVSGTITGAIVGFVRQQCGEDGVRWLLESAGETRTVEELEDVGSWGSYAAAVRLFEAAEGLIDAPDVARRVGAHLLDRHAGTEVAGIRRLPGSTEELLRNVATTGAKYSAVTSLEVLRLEEGFASIVAVSRGGVVRRRHFCDYTAGVLSQAPAVFGYEAAEVVEVECERRGDARCLYEVRWRTTDDDRSASQLRIHQLETQLAGLTSRFEALQATATAFVSAHNSDEVLATITKRAGLAVRAPRFLLAVQLPSERRLRVHHEGFDSDAEARATAREILSGAAAHRPAHLVVNVVSARSKFGVLAAIHSRGEAFFPEERRLLEAYAAHAAAALEVTSALEEARRQNGTARALLAFGRSLARVATADAIVSRLTEALPAVVDCDAGAVVLWDDANRRLRVQSTFGLSPEAAAQFEGLAVAPEDSPAISLLLRDLEPLFIEIGTEDSFLAGLLSMASMQSAAIVPIVVPDGLVGVVAVGRLDAEIRSNPDVAERLTGMADLAATAFVNARFLERVQTEALQDPLTGLANVRMLTRTADRALAAQTPIALLFVDLDGFKPINDSFGHDAGDEVLRTCGRRLRSAVRDSDLVARIGGDEFVVLMPNAGPDAAEATASRLKARLVEPISVSGHQIQLSGSVGVAVASTEDDFRSLLKRADDAMYVAKGRRSATSAINSEAVERGRWTDRTGDQR